MSAATTAIRTVAVMGSIILGAILTSQGSPIGGVFTIAGIIGSVFVLPKTSASSWSWPMPFHTDVTEHHHEHHHHTHNHQYGALTEGTERTEERADGTAVTTRQIRRWN